MTYETIAELLAYVQMYSLKSNWICLVWHPNQFSNLSANFSFALIFCWWTLIRHIARCPWPFLASWERAGSVRRDLAGRWQHDTHVQGYEKLHVAHTVSTALAAPYFLSIWGGSISEVMRPCLWSLPEHCDYLNCTVGVFSDEVNLLATLSSGFLQNTSN